MKSRQSLGLYSKTRAFSEDLQRCYRTQCHFLGWNMARILHDVSGKRWWEYPALKDFFFKPWSQQLRRLLRKIQISCQVIQLSLGKEMGENHYLLGCYYCQLKRHPLHWKEKIPVAASLQKHGTGSSSLFGTGLIAEFKFGYVKEFLFFLLMPLVFTAQK